MERYLRVLRSIPAGSTRTPREIAEAAGKPGAARTVGRLLRQCAADSLRRSRGIAPWPPTAPSTASTNVGYGAHEALDFPSIVARDRSPLDPDGTPTLAERMESWPWTQMRTELLSERSWSKVGHAFTPAECEQWCRAFAEDSRFDRTVDMAPRGFGIGRYRYLCEPLPEPLTTLRARCYAELVAAARSDRDFTGGTFFLENAADGRREEIALDEGDLLLFPSARRACTAGGRESGSEVMHGMTTLHSGERYAFGLVFSLAK